MLDKIQTRLFSIEVESLTATEPLPSQVTLIVSSIKAIDVDPVHVAGRTRISGVSRATSTTLIGGLMTLLWSRFCSQSRLRNLTSIDGNMFSTPTLDVEQKCFDIGGLLGRGNETFAPFMEIRKNYAGCCWPREHCQYAHNKLTGHTENEVIT